MSKVKESKNPNLSDEGKAAIASGEWKEYFDDKKGKYYYLHVKEKKTVWDLDVELKKRASATPEVDSTTTTEMKSNLLRELETRKSSTVDDTNNTQTSSNNAAFGIKLKSANVGERRDSTASIVETRKNSTVDDAKNTQTSSNNAAFGIKLKSANVGERRDSTASLSPPKDKPVSLPPPKDKSVSLPPPKDKSVSLPPPKDKSVPLPPPKDKSVSLPPPKDKRVSLPPPKDKTVPLSPVKDSSPSMSPVRNKTVVITSPSSNVSPPMTDLAIITGDTILRDHEENQGALQSLLDHNKRLQEMLAAGMNGPIALDFGGKLDALTRTNHSLTIQIKRLNREHEAMVRALTDANVRIYEQRQELEALQRSEGVRTISLSNDGNKGTNDSDGVTMTHLRESNRQLLQQVGELSALLARSLADQSYTAAIMNDRRGIDSEGTKPSSGEGGYQYGGYNRSVSGAGRVPLHNPYSAYLTDGEIPQYEHLDANGQHTQGFEACYPGQSQANQYRRSPVNHNMYSNQSAAIGGYPQRSSSLTSTVCVVPQYGHYQQQQQQRSGYNPSPNVLDINGQLGHPPKSSTITYGGFIVRNSNSAGRRSTSCR